jgi:putative hydroxymethylpyrimidine transport system permease protein
MSAKVMMAVLVIFFPVTSAFLTVCVGLTTTISIWRAPWAPPWRATAPRSHDGRPPALGSGLRMAAAVAPIGAIIGEWVGSAEGGYVMLNANARLQTDICFAALFILVLLTVLLWLAVDALHRLIDWTPE